MVQPTIGYADGQLKFSDTTTGAQYHYTLSCSDVQSDKLNEDGNVDLAACYDISVMLLLTATKHPTRPRQSSIG